MKIAAKLQYLGILASLLLTSCSGITTIKSPNEDGGLGGNQDQDVVEKKESGYGALCSVATLFSKLVFYRNSLFHRFFLFLDHSTNHFATDRTGFFRSKVTIVTFF